MKTRRKITVRRSDCPISFGLDIFGDKWTLLILRDILFYERVRFSDFTPNERIATNILSDRLMTLEEAGIIRKKKDKQLRNQYIYSVTRKGKDLIPVLVEHFLWGLRYDKETPASKAYVRSLKKHKEREAHQIRDAVEKGSFLEYRKKHMGA